MDTILHDLRFAVRSLAKAPAFTAAATLCIALGIAANVFVMSPVNALLLRPLPYPQSERLVHLSTWRTDGERRTYGAWSYADYLDVAERRDVFSAVGAHLTRTWNVGGGSEPERLAGARVTASLFPLLGLQPALGRFFLPEEEADAPVVVIGYGVWERKFGADPQVVGKAIPIDGAPHTVIGVMARGVRVPEIEDIWLPVAPGEMRGRRDLRGYQVTARLADGVSMAQADARVVSLMRTLEERHGDSNHQLSAWAVPLNDLIAREVRPIFLLMLGAVAFVLLIACANVANLLLARGAAREREVAVRLSMGASRARIVRQLLTESLVLAAAGGVLGILLGTWGVELFITRMMPTTVPYWMRFDVDRTIVAVSVVTIAATGLLFGLMPALQLSRPALAETLKASGRGGSAHARAGRTRSTLVVSELVLSLVLLVGAGLMMRSFLRTQQAPLGYDTQQLLTFQVALAGERYANDTARAAFRRALDERLAAIPGVVSVGATSQLPIADCCMGTRYHTDAAGDDPSRAPSTYLANISPSYLETMRIALRTGRSFTDAESRGVGRVAIVDSVLAARAWPGESALGQSLRLGSHEGEPYTVVGVVGHQVVRQVQEVPGPQAFIPLPEAHAGDLWFALRTGPDPEALVPRAREALRALDPDLPLARLASMEFHVRDRMFQARVYGSMFAIFAGTALLLATIGLYGVMSYLVAQRTRELGVRMALGASAHHVMRLVVGNGVRLIALGLLIGVPASIALAQLLRGALFGVTATDPVTLVLVPLALATIALVASWIPARRATRVDPMVALRAE